jgi:hypothetical protein
LEVRKITLVFPYYEAPKMLAVQLLNILGYTEDTRQMLDIIIVDDGSPVYPAKGLIDTFRLPIKVSVYRVKCDIPWNNHGARNLGVMQSPEGSWILGLDIKHIVPASCMDFLVWDRSFALQPGNFYTFACRRLEAAESGMSVIRWMQTRQGKPCKPHPNTYLICREDFWRVGGYNEDYCGTYGGDGEFIGRVKSKLVESFIDPDKFWVIRVDKTIISDAMAMQDTRSYFKELFRQVKSEHRTPVNPIRFEWEQVL